MPPARCVLGIAWDFVAEAERITVRNRNPGGNSAAVADRYTVTHADRNADPDAYTNAHMGRNDDMRCRWHRPRRKRDLYLREWHA